MKDSPKADGCEEIFIPGEIESRNYDRARQLGISLSDPLRKELESLAAECGIPFDAEM